MVHALVFGDAVIAVTAQVERLAHLALLEQGGVAGTRLLGNLVLHGVEHDLILARRDVGMHGDVVACHLPAGDVLGLMRHRVGGAVAQRVLALLDGEVQRVADYPRRVVALQLHHHFQVVAQVVVRHRTSQGLGALYLAAHHAAAQPHLGQVPQIHVGNVALPVVLGRVLLVVLVDVVAVVLEDVAVLLDLYAVRAGRHTDGEGTLVVGLHALLLVVVERLVVHTELGTGHGDAAAVVEHLA